MCTCVAVRSCRGIKEYPSGDFGVSILSLILSLANSDHLAHTKLQSLPVNPEKLLALEAVLLEPSPWTPSRKQAVPALKHTLSVQGSQSCATSRPVKCVLQVTLRRISGALSLCTSFHSRMPPEPPATSDSLRPDLCLIKSLSSLCSVWAFCPRIVIPSMSPCGSQSDRRGHLACFPSPRLLFNVWKQFALYILSSLLMIYGIRASVVLVTLSGQIWKCELLCF